MIECYYENHNGEVLNLMQAPYLLQTGDFYDSSWKYESVELVTGGSKIISFYKEMKSLQLLLSIVGTTKTIYDKAVDRFNDVTEIDVFEMKPGKLYVDGYYLLGYFIDCKVDEWEYGIPLQDREVKFIAENGMWRSDVGFRFKPSSRTEDYEYLDLPYDLPYDLMPDVLFQYLDNDFGRACEFTMVIYGPVVDPKITINNHIYEVLASIYDDEYVVIDSEAGTVIRYTRDGVPIDLYNSWNTESSVFEKIQPKKNVVNWNHLFGFDIELHRERSEPSCSSK